MKVTRYHLTEEGPKPCTASKRACPVGGAHYPTVEEAQEAYGQDRGYSALPSTLHKHNTPEGEFVLGKGYRNTFAAHPAYRGPTVARQVQAMRRAYEDALQVVRSLPPLEERYPLREDAPSGLYLAAVVTNGGDTKLEVKQSIHPGILPYEKPPLQRRDDLLFLEAEDQFSQDYLWEDDDRTPTPTLDTRTWHYHVGGRGKQELVAEKTEHLYRAAYETSQRDDLPSWAALPSSAVGRGDDWHTVQETYDYGKATRQREKQGLEKQLQKVRREAPALSQARTKEAEAALELKKRKDFLEQVGEGLTGRQRGDAFSLLKQAQKEHAKADKTLTKALRAKKQVGVLQGKLRQADASLEQLQQEQPRRRRAAFIEALASHHPSTKEEERKRAAEEWVAVHPSVVDKPWDSRF